MSIFINKKSKIITQGITGKAGKFHTNLCVNYAKGKKMFVAGIHPNKKGFTKNNIPIYNSVIEAKKKTNANISIIYVPAFNAAKAIWESVISKIRLIICITEGIPIIDMLKIKFNMKKIKSKSLILGPNCPGIIIPQKVKIGIMPHHIYKKGFVGIVSRSGTLTYEIAYNLSINNIGQSGVVGIGGDPIHGLDYIDIIKKFYKDKNTKIIIMIGEIGGNKEIEAANWIKKNKKKPIIAFIAGSSAPKGKRMGHAGALISKYTETAEYKINILKKCGIKVTLNPLEIPEIVKKF